MPIRDSEKARYPKNWPDISRSIRERAGYCCEECGVQNYELGGRSPTGKWHKARPLGEKLLGFEWPEPGSRAICIGYDLPLRIMKIVLTVAHLNHQPEDCRPENLKCWCQQCHLRYDAKMKADGIKKRRNERLGQGELI